MDSQFYTKEAAATKAAVVQTALATSKFHMCQSPFTPNQFSTKAELTAAKCTFDGYTTAGYAITAWVGPDNNTAGGYKITSPALHPAYGPAGDPPVTNVVTGWWVETTGGDVWIAGVFDPPITMAQEGDAITWIRAIVEGFNVSPPA